LGCDFELVELQRKEILPESEARTLVRRSKERFDELRLAGAPHGAVRTAECDCFGAENRLQLARTAADGRLDAVLTETMPAEINVLTIGSWRFVCWPGEIYTSFGLDVKKHCRDCFVISLANGELHGYLTSDEAVRLGHYEANSGLFANPDSGNSLVRHTLELLKKRQGSSP
jgi:neutral ceramidase